MRFQRNRHSVFLLTYHLIMCIKYRHEVIDERLGVAIKSIAKPLTPLDILVKYIKSQAKGGEIFEPRFENKL